MARRKPYNPHTTYGRRRTRELSQERFNKLPEDQKVKVKTTSLILIAIVCVIMWLILGTDGFLKWASH